MTLESQPPPVIARVFARRTNATPTDALAFYDEPGLFVPDISEVHVSVTFTWDVRRAERLARAWERIAPVTIGGPGTNMRGEEFTPGIYLKPGYVITSRGCPNKCWFCSVWRREGQEVRELPIRDGWNVLDDNLLACSERHVRAVFDMLGRQVQPIQFTGGLEAARLQHWHVELLRSIKLGQVFFAYDEEADFEPLNEAGKLLREAGYRHLDHRLRCYVLIGYPKDTLSEADLRLRRCADAGFLPMAMLWRTEQGERDITWSRFQKYWARPASIAVMLRDKTPARVKHILELPR